eukprot:Ihof_evm15s20 gene=Ihof_evmTU15s20
MTTSSLFISDRKPAGPLPTDTLILPAVTVGNIGQLVVDLVVYNLGLPWAGSLYHPSLLPVCGSHPYGNTSAPHLATSADVYASEERKISVVQHRAPPAQGCQGIYAAALHQWITTMSFKNIVLLTSLDAANWRHIDALRSSPLCFLATAQAYSVREKLTDLGWIDLEPLLGEEAIATIKGGIGPELFRLAKEADLPLVTVVRVCSEGDNVADAMVCASGLSTWLGLQGPNHTT